MELTGQVFNSIRQQSDVMLAVVIFTLTDELTYRCYYSKLLIQFPPQTFFRRFPLLQFAAGKLPL